MRQKVANLHSQTPSWKREALARIAQQSALVATLYPNTNAHKRATGVLLVLQDSLHAMSEAHATLDGIRRRRAGERSHAEDN